MPVYYTKGRIYIKLGSMDVSEFEEEDVKIIVELLNRERLGYYVNFDEIREMLRDSSTIKKVLKKARLRRFFDYLEVIKHDFPTNVPIDHKGVMIIVTAYGAQLVGKNCAIYMRTSLFYRFFTYYLLKNKKGMLKCLLESTIEINDKIQRYLVQLKEFGIPVPYDDSLFQMLDSMTEQTKQVSHLVYNGVLKKSDVLRSMFINWFE